MRLYVVIKNSILIWDMLTGQIHDILQNQSDQEISSISLVPNSGRFVVGDSQGSIYLRKLQNGIKISKIYKSKSKSSVNHIITKQGGVWNQCVIIGIFQDCEVVVFGKDQSNDFTLMRNFNVRKYYPNVLILSAQYEEKRNLLIIGTNNGDIICMDVDKNRVANHIQANNFEPVKFIIKFEIPSIVSFGKNGQIFGMYLPPHSKKFKSACNLLIEGSKPDLKIVSIAMAKLSDNCYIGYENGAVSQILLTSSLVSNQCNLSSSYSSNSQNRKIYEQWSVKLSEAPKDITLINNQKVLAIILYLKNVTFISAENGDVLNTLPSYVSLESGGKFYEDPLCYYNNGAMNALQKQKQNQKKERQTKNQIYLPETKKYYPIDPLSKPIDMKYESNAQQANKKSDQFNNLRSQLRIFHDPFYLYEQYCSIMKEIHKKKEVKFNISSNATGNPNLNRNEEKKIVWNEEWKIFPQFRQYSNKNLQQIIRLKKQIQAKEEKPAKRVLKGNKSAVLANLQRVADVQKKWEQLKDQIEDQALRKSNTSKMMTFSSFKMPLNLALTDKKGQKEKKQKQSTTDNDQKTPQKKARDSDGSVLITKHKSLHSSQSSPLIRLGLALQKINEKDEKAMRFIQLGQKQNNEAAKQTLKLPKIRNKQ